MLDIEGIVLHKILLSGDLDNFSKLRLNFFSKLYSPLFKELLKFYHKHGKVATFDDLVVSCKEPSLSESIHALRILKTPDVPTELAIQSLMDRYIQDEALTGIEKILTNISFYDTGEIKESIGKLLLDLDSKLNTDENILYANQLKIFEERQLTETKKVPTGLSNWIDANIGGFFEEDLVLIGGFRGAGKSVICANIAVNQYLQGNVGVYFTIEMTGQETFGRMMSILSQVEYSKIKLNKLHIQDDRALAKVRAEMFENADQLYEEFIEHNDKFKFERDLIGTKHLKKDNQFIIIDDRELTIPSIDFTVQKLKAVHGDKLKVVVVDYVNQVSMGGLHNDLYDWKDQMAVSKQLKNIARKHKITIVSPYQIDDSGVARLSKGILDACDLALILAQEPGHIILNCTKSRSSSSKFKVKLAFNSDTLTIDPTEIPISEEEEPSSKKKKKIKDDDDI